MVKSSKNLSIIRGGGHSCKSKRTTFLAQLLVFSLTSLAFIPQSYADCINPPGVEGQQIFNSTYKTMQFCDGATWYGMKGGGGGGSSVWSKGEGDTIFFQSGAEKVGIGIDAPTEALHVDGNILATGTVTGSAPVASTDMANKDYVDTAVAAAGSSNPVITLWSVTSSIPSCPSGWSPIHYGYLAVINGVPTSQTSGSGGVSGPFCSATTGSFFAPPGNANLAVNGLSNGRCTICIKN